MPKTIECPVKKWPGTVTFIDPLAFGQYVAWRAALLNAKALGEQALKDDWDMSILPGVLAAIESFSLEGLPSRLTIDTFPATPRKASGRLVAWLVDQVSAIAFSEDEEIPNP